MLEKITVSFAKAGLLGGLVFSLCLMQSCRKETDKEFPKIDILVPSENQYFYLPDTIPITVDVSDNKSLEYVRLMVANENFVAVAPTITRYPDENPTTIAQAIAVNDVQLPSGEYYVIVTAFDGVNEKTEYRKIGLIAVEKKFMGVVFVDDAGNSQVDMYRVDTLYSKQLLATKPNDFGGSAVSSINQSYYLMGDVLGAMQSVKLNTEGVDWSIAANPLPPAPYYTGVCTYDGRVYFSSYDSKIQGAGKAGNVILTIETGNYVPFTLHRQGEMLLSEERQVSSGQKRLAQYYEATGAYKGAVTLDMEIVSFCERSANHVLVFGNNGNQGHMQDYDIENNGFYEPHSMPAGKVISTCRIDENNFMIGHETGILWYRYNANSLVTFKAGVQASGIQYNDVDNIIIASSDDELNYFSFPAGNLIQTVGHSNPIKGMQIYYNK